MPHAGLINSEMKEVDSQLLRAKLHYRGGKIRLQMGDTDHGIAALYDAVLSAMRGYTLNSNLISSLNLPTRHSEMDDENLFLLIKSLGMIDESISIDDFQYVVRITEDALNFRTKQKDIHGFIKRIENILSQLEILPLNERELPRAESKII